MHLGTEPRSKAYWLYDPIKRRIVVSRDVIFDEDKFWNWKDCDGKDDTGTITIQLGEYGNHGIKVMITEHITRIKVTTQQTKKEKEITWKNKPS